MWFTGARYADWLTTDLSRNIPWHGRNMVYCYCMYE